MLQFIRPANFKSYGDNLAVTFCPELADLTIYVIDVAGGDKILRNGAPALRSSRYQQNRFGSTSRRNVKVMEADALRMRVTRPVILRS